MLSGETGSGYERYHAGQEEMEREKEKDREREAEASKSKNRVLGVLMSRLGDSKTFGENVIFMLNRCGESKSFVF